MVFIQIKLDNHLKTQVDLASSSINNGRVGEVKTYKHYFAITIQKYSDNFNEVAKSTIYQSGKGKSPRSSRE